MSFDVYNASGAKIANNLSEGQLEGYYKDGFIRDNDKVVETTYLEKNRKEKMPYYNTQVMKDIANAKFHITYGKKRNETAVMRDINNVKKRRG